MEIPPQITARDIELSPETETAIREQATHLDSYYNHIISCRISVETLRRFRTGEDALYNLRIDLTLPGGEVVVTRQPHADLMTAIQEAFDAAQRRLQDYARRQRGEVKSREPQPHARVTKLFPFEGYGFLETANAREIYFHRNSVLNGGFDRLEIGVEVRFVEEQGDNGPQASTVAVVGKGRK